MIEVCITICIVVALICTTVCYVYKQQMYNGTDLSEQQLLEDIYIIANKAYYINRKNIESITIADDNDIVYVTANNALSTIDSIIKLTEDYKKENN